MVSPLFYYHLGLLAIVWLFALLHVAWPNPGVTSPPEPAKLIKPRRSRTNWPQQIM